MPSTLLAIQHVPWEGPHRILDACDGLAVRTVRPLDGEPLPKPAEVAATAPRPSSAARPPRPRRSSPPARPRASGPSPTS